jgi:hypothetical protein
MLFTSKRCLSAAVILGLVFDAGYLGAQSNYATPYTFTTLAGRSAMGSNDGAGTNARFTQPMGVAADGAGNVYVADTLNSTIRKITPAGAVTTLAGTAGKNGSDDGTGSAAQFDNPYGVAVDNAGNVYVADSWNNTIRKITAAGIVTTLAGTAGSSGSSDGIGSAAKFDFPTGVAADSLGNIYVVDGDNSTIRKITAAGVVTTLAGAAGSSGSNDGTGSAAQFSFVFSTGITVDSAGNVYVADTQNNTIRKITAGGVVTTLAGTAGKAGSEDGPGSAAQFNDPTGVAVDSAGNVYVADAWNDTIRKITPDGVVTTLAGSSAKIGSIDGPGSAASFYMPNSVAVDRAGNVYVADMGNEAIRAISTTDVVTTLAGCTYSSGSNDGIGGAARFDGPTGVAVDSAGSAYVADEWNDTIRKVMAGGVVTTLAGSPGISGAVDGMGSHAKFNNPIGVAVDNEGNVYVADSGNYTIRKVTSAGVVTTLAGSPGVWGSADGTGSAAQFGYPTGVAADGAGNVYVADSWNNTIRKVTSAGVVTTLAGSPGVSGSVDGTGGNALFNGPTCVAVDSTNNVYVTDAGNCTIRKIAAGGFVTTLAGSPGTFGWTDGTGSGASFGLSLNAGVAVDGAGNVYVGDWSNELIRKIAVGGVVTTLAGYPTYGSVDGSGSAARFKSPSGVAVDNAGRLYVADEDNNTSNRFSQHGSSHPIAAAKLCGRSQFECAILGCRHSKSGADVPMVFQRRDDFRRNQQFLQPVECPGQQRRKLHCGGLQCDGQRHEQWGDADGECL